MAILRATPEDFRVVEMPLYEPDGSGTQTWLEVEKRDLTTDRLLRLLADRAGLPDRELGYAGRKDRRAVTRQWISVPRVDPAEASTWEGDGWRVLAAERNGEKLRLGELVGNRFEIVVREVDEASLAGAEERLDLLKRVGLVNRFGDQRFGRHGGNAEKGFAILRGETRAPRDRRLARLLVSAAQSEIFHRVLDRRGDPPWRILPGDVVVEHTTDTWRVVDDPVEVAADLDALKVSPTAPLPGPKVLRPRGEAAELERDVLGEVELPTPIGKGLPRWLAPRGDRRAIRVSIGANARCEIDPTDRSLTLVFQLPPGSYATVLIEAVLGSPPEVAR